MHRRLVTLSVGAVVAAFVGGPAFAEGAADALGYTWGGIYAGINAGYGWGNSDWSFANGSGSTSNNDNGYMAGIQVGYNAKLSGNLVIGIEGTLDAADMEGKSSCLSGAFICRTRVDSTGDLSGRIGINTDSTLLFAKGGIAYEEATHSIFNNSSFREDQGDATFGVLLGGGAEYALTKNLTTKLEYDYVYFGSQSSSVGTIPISNSSPFNVVKFGINLKFD